MSPIKQLPSKAHFNDQLTSPRRLCVCVCETEREREREKEITLGRGEFQLKGSFI